MFYTNLIIVFILLPVLFSISWIVLLDAIGKNNTGCGFSIIVAGLLGYLPFSLLNFLRKSKNLQFKKWYSLLYLILLINAFIIVTTYGQYLLMVPIIILSVLCLFLTLNDVHTLLAFFLELSKKRRSVELPVIASASFLILFGATLLFPASIKNQDGIVNIFAHLFGYLFVFYSHLVLSNLSPIINRNKPF
jgi:hypothetical protein